MTAPDSVAKTTTEVSASLNGSGGAKSSTMPGCEAYNHIHPLQWRGVQQGCGFGLPLISKFWIAFAAATWKWINKTIQVCLGSSSGLMDQNIEMRPKMSGLLWRTAAKVFPKMIARVGRSTTTRLWAVTGWTSSDQCTTNIDICVDDEYVWDDVAQCINVNRCESIGLCMLLCLYAGTNSVLLIGSVYIYRTQFFCVSFCLQFMNLMYLSMYLLICP